MAKYLFDENLPPRVARGLRAIGFDTLPIGDPAAPPRGSSDSDNIAWCRERGAVLFTLDRGRKDNEILQVLKRHTDAHVVFLPDGMSAMEVSQVFHRRVEAIEELLGRGRRVRKKVTRSGGFHDAE